MRGQSSAEMLILVGAILIAVASMLYLGIGSNESAVVMRAARDGAENAIAAIDVEYGCSIDIENLSFYGENITISVVVRNGPPSDMDWEDFEETIKENIRNEALRYMHNAIGGNFPVVVGPVKTSYHTYDVTVNVRRVTKYG